MSTILRSNSAQKNLSNKSTTFREDPHDLNEESANKISEALKSTKNLDELVATVVSANKFKSATKKNDNNENISPFKRTLSNSKSAATISALGYFQQLDPINSSDEEECTFHPKINDNANRISQRIIPNNNLNEFLYREASERALKLQESDYISNLNREKNFNRSNIDSKSVHIVFKRLQQAMKNLINEAESSDTKGYVSFEGLGTILYKIGVFQNIEYRPDAYNPERSSVWINHARVKPERLAREIQFHESLWKICVLPSKDSNLVTSELLFKFLLVLVEEKAHTSESASLLQESIDMALEASGREKKQGLSVYADLKDEKGLWSLEKVVMEFRRLFDNKTFFMPIYHSSASTSSLLVKKEKNTEYYPHNHRPEVNKNSQKLDVQHFNKTFKKKIEKVKPDLKEQDLKDRKLRLFNYHKYLINKKNTKVETKIQEELAPCTFTPSITPFKNNKKKVNQSAHDLLNSSPQKGYFNQVMEDKTGAKRHLLLYGIGHQYREKLHQKAYTQKKQEEIQELSHCTFQPRLNVNYEYSEVRGQDFYDGIPRGFKRSVERLNKGKQQAEKLKAALDKVPRGENYERNKNAKFNPPSQLTRPKIQSSEVLVYVDVSIGHGRTGRIGIHKGDNAKMLAHHFARTYSLNANMKESLEKLLQSYIDSYFALVPTEQAEQNPASSKRQRYREEDEDEYEEDEDEDEDEDDDEEDPEGVEEVDEEDEEDERP